MVLWMQTQMIFLICVQMVVQMQVKKACLCQDGVAYADEEDVFVWKW